MFRATAATSVAVALSATVSLLPAPAVAEKFALVVGVNVYDCGLPIAEDTQQRAASGAASQPTHRATHREPGQPDTSPCVSANLISAENDAKRIAEWLGSTHEFADVKMLLSSAIDRFDDSQVRRRHTIGEKIVREWKRTIDRLEGDDVVFFYFAGHGIELKGRNYLQPSDTDFSHRARPSDDRTTGAMTGTSIDFQKLLELLGERQETHPGVAGIFIIDACRENPLILADDLRDVMSVGLSGEQLPNTDIFVMYSAGIGQKAIDVDRQEVDPANPEEHSVFFNALRQELSRKAGRPVTLGELSERIRFAVSKRARELQPLSSQIPAVYSQLKDPRTFTGNVIEQPVELKAADTEVLALKPDQRLPDGSVLMECSACPEVVVLPKPGRPFEIGSPTGEKGRSRLYEEQVSVTLAHRFAIGRYEVTNREWNLCVDSGGCDGRRGDAHHPETARQPVTGVSWNEATGYTKWLTGWLREKSGNSTIEYRLPTEIEWEYAARGGKLGKDATAFAFGNGPGPELCHHANGADRAIGVLPHSYQFCSDGVGRGVSQVGKYRANGFGLNDMSGNAWEWTSTCWSDKHQASDAQSAQCSHYAARGGSWRSGWEALRSAARNRFPKGHSRPTLGFRVVRVIDDTECKASSVTPVP